MSSFVAGARLQFRILLSDRAYLNEIIANPFFALIFLAMIRHAGRQDLTSYALVAPVLITLWALSLDISGDIISSDRELGVVEEAVAAPSSFAGLVLGRILTVSLVASIAIVETGLVAVLLFSVDIDVHHPLVLGTALLATCIAMSGTALVMAAVFVMARSARTFQGTLNYPIYLVGGFLVPVSFLPEWLQPLSRLLFTSWSADLMRDAFRPEPVEHVIVRLMIVLLLGGIGLAVGRFALARVLRRVRASGSLAHA